MQYKRIIKYIYLNNNYFFKVPKFVKIMLSYVFFNWLEKNISKVNENY